MYDMYEVRLDFFGCFRTAGLLMMDRCRGCATKKTLHVVDICSGSAKEGEKMDDAFFFSGESEMTHLYSKNRREMLL